ncbi:hypothetical protein [Silvania hatchlandensis]|uniref:Uncharacterized protein n=1 Tax=Silvania hatchlandensis TaxID=2926469 RepID=A0A9J6Q7A9_9ENTR|nr:hypothetical protein [Silvania hatchlandensis]MCU6666099.1 hypothetical protein [Silvania hatchlandensis]
MTNIQKIAKVLKLLNQHHAKTSEFVDASLVFFEKIIDAAEEINNKDAAVRTHEENAVYTFVWTLIPEMKKCLALHNEYNESFRDQYIDAIKLLSSISEANKNA